MGVYARGPKLWIRFRDARGTWRDAATGYNVGQEELAQTMHDETVARIVATTKTVKHAPARGLTVRGFVAEWLPKRRERGLDWKADEGRGAAVTPPLAHARGVSAVAWSPDGKRVTTASFDQTARVWDVSWDTGTLADWRAALERCDYRLNSVGVLVARDPKAPASSPPSRASHPD